MSNIIDTFNDQDKAKRERMDEVSLFLRDCPLPKPLQLTLTSFYRKQEVKAYNFPKLLSVLPYRMRLTVILSVFQDVIANVPFLRDHSDDAPFLIEVLSRCTRTRFSTASLLRMQQAAELPEQGSAGGNESHACLFAAGTFESDIYIVHTCAPPGSHVLLSRC
jgi:hypothetical protein